MKRKRALSIMMVIVIISVIMIGCGGKGNTDSMAEGQNKFKIKVVSILSDNDPETLGLMKFKELVESKSEGNIVVELYPNAQLGSAETYLDTLRQGTVQMASPGSVMAQLQPLVGAPEMPFLFRDWEHAQKVLTDPKMTEALSEGMVEKHGIRTLGFAPRSFRVISSNQEISTLEDLKGLRIRTPNIPFYIELFKDLHTSPVALPLTELFSSLEQNVVTAQENPYSTIETSKLYEVQDYVFESNHIFTTHGWYMNEKFFQGLPEEYQKVVLESADEAIDYTFEINIDQEEKSKEILKEAGIKITVPSEEVRESMQETAKPAREFFYKEYPGSEEWAKLVEAIE